MCTHLLSDTSQLFFPCFTTLQMYTHLINLQLKSIWRTSKPTCLEVQPSNPPPDFIISCHGHSSSNIWSYICVHISPTVSSKFNLLLPRPFDSTPNIFLIHFFCILFLLTHLFLPALYLFTKFIAVESLLNTTLCNYKMLPGLHCSEDITQVSTFGQRC